MLKVITDYDELWGWANNVIYNRLNPNKDLYFKPTTPTPVEQQAQQAPVVEPVVEVKPVEKENDDLFASLGDEQLVSPLEDIASSVTPTSAVTMFDEVVVAKEEEINQEEAVKPKPMFGRKPKSKPNKVLTSEPLKLVRKQPVQMMMYLHQLKLHQRLKMKMTMISCLR